MALGIASFRRSRKEEIKPQESAPQEPLTQPEATDPLTPLTAKEIAAAVEKLKSIRSRLRNNKKVEAAKLAVQQLPNVLATINSKANHAQKNRGQLFLNGQDPDAMLRNLSEEKRQAEESAAALKVGALEELRNIYHEHNAVAGVVSSRAWKEWQTFRKDLLSFVGRYGDLGARLGLPVGLLAQEVENFNSEFNRAQLVIPDSGATKPPVRVPRLGRGYSWNEFQKVVHAIKTWLI